MTVLVTNDDGIYSDGLRAVVRALKEISRVIVCAPDRERSATGHAITVFRPLRVESVILSDLDVEAWMVDGTPSDCVKLACEVLLAEPPNVVVSGINRGPNLGMDVLYSGTVSAAIEGAIMGIPSMAVSVAAFEDCNYSGASAFATRMVKKVVDGILPANTLLNINVPSMEDSEIAGVAVTKLGTRKYKDVFDKRIDPRGRTYYWLAGEMVECDKCDDVDAVAIKNNMISVTPIHFDLTRYELLDELRKLDLK
ncbi:MAG: 5'/3'-nucleotidase SurE [Firmicutes bacterium]|nr:5'/3'-nucleotidase SurE [Bacillota bacterium]